MSKSFLIYLQQLFDSRQTEDLLTPFRKKGWQQFLTIGLPTKSQEAFRYVSLKELYDAPLGFSPFRPTKIDKSFFSKEILPECKHSHIVFIDGHFSKELSDISALPSPTVLLPLDEAFHSHASFLQNHFTRSLKEETDPFAWINFALHPLGAFFYLPPNLSINVPVQCLHLTTAETPQSFFPRFHIILGGQSQLHWISTYYSLKSDLSHIVLPALEIFLEEGAAFHLLHVMNDSKSWHMESVRALLKKHARLDTFAFTTEGKIVRQSYRVQLNGEGGQANLNGLWMLHKNSTAHTHVIIDHKAPHTQSMQLFKGILNGSSQSSFEGKIIVRQEAQKTEAYQLNNNLILTPGAIANSKPNLEVFADDVKASHGATISQLSEEPLFYLATRGIGKTEAKRLLIHGFCREMIHQIAYPSILQKIQKEVELKVS